MLNCLFFRIFSSVRMKWVWASARYLAFGRTPGHRRLAKCDAGSFVGTSSISFASAQSAKAHPFRCASSQNRNRFAGLRFCVFCARRRNAGFFGCAAHTPAAGVQSHTAATRASRRGAGARPAGRVDRVDFPHGGKIGTFGTPERDQPLAVAAVGLDQNSVSP